MFTFVSKDCTSLCPSISRMTAASTIILTYTHFVNKKKMAFHEHTGGSLAMILGTDVRLESPNPTPFIYQAKWKTWPIHILPISKIDPIHILFLKIDPIHILFFKFYPFIYFLGEKDTPLIYFWCKNDTHSYTGRPEKYTPFQPHICIYLYNGSYPPRAWTLHRSLTSDK